MFLFPIFCFGVVIAGIVALGVHEAVNRANQIAASPKVSEPTGAPRKADTGSEV